MTARKNKKEAKAITTDAGTAIVLSKYKELSQNVFSQPQFNWLYAPTPKYAIKEREIGDGKFAKYVPHGFVEDRLNKAFGGDWDFEVIPMFGGQPFHATTRDELYGGKMKIVTTVTVCGRITVRIRNPKDVKEVVTTISKQEFGSATWRDKMEFGDALKGAASDALKRCGLRFGIALDLYYDDEAVRLKYEAYQNLSSQTGQTAGQVLDGSAVDVTPGWNTATFITEAKRQKGLNLPKILSQLKLNMEELGEAIEDKGKGDELFAKLKE